MILGRMNRFGLLLLVTLLAAILGCSQTTSAEEVKDRDNQRKEVSKNMPGSDVPVDPADGGR
jgi:hypothetical protein